LRLGRSANQTVLQFLKNRYRNDEKPPSGGFFRLGIIVTFVAQNISDMKKALIILAFALFGVFTAQAQIWIGGAVNASFNKEIKTFSIAPDIGYCIPSTPFSIACAVEYGGTFQQGEAYSQSLTLSPYFRYGICDLNERFSLFADLYSDFEVLDFGSFDIGLSPGISFDLTEHWSAEFSVGLLEYNWERIPDEKPSQTFRFFFETAVPSFGIYYNF